MCVYDMLKSFRGPHTRWSPVSSVNVKRIVSNAVLSLKLPRRHGPLPRQGQVGEQSQWYCVWPELLSAVNGQAGVPLARNTSGRRTRCFLLCAPLYSNGMKEIFLTFGSYECPKQRGPAEVGLVETGPAEVGFVEVGIDEVSLAEVGSAEVGSAEMGLSEVGSAEIGLAEIGFAEIGFAEIGPTEVNSL